MKGMEKNNNKKNHLFLELPLEKGNKKIIGTLNEKLPLSSVKKVITKSLTFSRQGNN